MTPSHRYEEALARILAPSPPAFALLHRPETTGPGTLDVLLGETSTADTTDLIPPAGKVLALVPYRHIAERGFDSPDDGEPLIALTVTEHGLAPVPELLGRIPDRPVRLTGKHFDVADDDYAEIVQRVITEEIGTGAGANFVIRRSFVADITDYTVHSALAFFKRLMVRESGAYWTFIVHAGDRTFVGATPERHISVREGTAVMNPISGTYRYPSSGPTLTGLMDFLADRKETEELYMVVDEELKMMARVCEAGGRVVGPHLREMARLAHTEYFIEGRTELDPREILRETMFAPTVTGSPLESAARVIARYEPRGRGYYSGVIALIDRDAAGGPALDSSILIRTADIDRTGRVRIGVGATLVRHSDPRAEVAETAAKAAGLIAALEAADRGSLGGHPEVRAALRGRNADLAEFWLIAEEERRRPEPALAGRRVLVVDAEDTFTFMIGHQLRSLGLEVTVRRYDEDCSFEAHDLVVMGPGPGDPRETGHPKIARLRETVDALLAERHPFLAVCLSHQVLSMRLGLPLVRRDVPNQGVQRKIEFFGRTERVGFYNTFAARSEGETLECPGVGAVRVSGDPGTGEVHGLLGPHFASMQFHAESVLTRDGLRLTAGLIADVLAAHGALAATSSHGGNRAPARTPAGRP
ncbi:anthranilate synthase family protein [Streptomyces sp. NPDC049687]|uniref:anthranilate synthase family protein n=1 Tax=Streptomyces sp. NPDC049687 TaxID=3365596 RepID=UPI0037B6063A